MTDAPEYKMLTPDGGLPTGNGWPDHMLVKYTRADLSPKVKPLGWAEENEGSGIWFAYFSETTWRAHWNEKKGAFAAYTSTHSFHGSTLDAAKAAAQAHHETLILSALVARGEE